MKPGCRHLVLVFGDQLDEQSPVFDGFDPKQDRVWMAEADEEATHVWCHQLRLVFFFAAMRHFRNRLEDRGWQVDYQPLESDRRRRRNSSLVGSLRETLQRLQPQEVRYCLPGDARVAEGIAGLLATDGVANQVFDDRHFLCTPAEFNQWAEGRKSLVLETFYRWMRRRHDVLMHAGGKPAGGEWNFDKENRAPFSKEGPTSVPRLKTFEPDDLTRQVIHMVEKRFADHPGKARDFDYPVTREQALEALGDFIENRLEDFGRYQDAMWTSQSYLYHSRLSAVLNVQLLGPREVMDAALAAHRNQRIALPSVEGFVRQILGWREFVRGVYWRYMPEYAESNELGCEDLGVPGSYWNGESRMNCVRNVMGQVIETGYAHHIQRLMVLGLFAQVAGVHPRRFHDWHMAMYVDAIDWVSLPNALGMSQYGDGGIVGTKPYCASGNYVDKMSNYCSGCEFHPKQATGPNACPITTFYWDFLDRHESRFANNGRMVFQIKNVRNKSAEERAAIRQQAETYRSWIREGREL